MCYVTAVCVILIVLGTQFGPLSDGYDVISDKKLRVSENSSDFSQSCAPHQLFHVFCTEPLSSAHASLYQVGHRTVNKKDSDDS